MSVASMAATMSAQITHMQMKKVKLEQEVDNLKKLKEKAQDGSLSILAKLEEYDDRNNSMHRDLNAITMGGIYSLKTHYQQLKAMNISAQSDKDQVSRNLDIIDSEVKDVLKVSSVEAVTGSMENVIEEFREKLFLTNQRKDEHTAILFEKYNQIAVLEKELSDVSGEEKQLQDTNNILSQNVDASNAQIKELREKIRISKDQSARYENESIRLQQERDEKECSLKTQKETLSLKLECIRGEAAKAKEVIEAKNKNIECIVAAIALEREREKELTQLLQQSRENFEEEKNSLEQVKSKLQQQSLVTQNEITVYEDQIEESTNSLKKHKETLKTKKDVLQTIEANTLNRKKEMDESMDKNLTLKENVKRIKDSAKQQEESDSVSMAQLNLQHTALKDALEVQRMEQEALREKTIHVQNQLQERTSELLSMQEALNCDKNVAEKGDQELKDNIKSLEEQAIKANEQVMVVQSFIDTQRKTLCDKKAELEGAEITLNEATVSVKKRLRENQAAQELDVLAGNEQVQKERELSALKQQLEDENKEYQEEVVKEREANKTKLDEKKAEAAVISQQRKEEEKKFKAHNQAKAQRAKAKERSRKQRRIALEKEMAASKKALAKSEKALAKQKQCLDRVKNTSSIANGADKQPKA